MSFAAYAVLWVALVVAAGLLATIRGRPRFTWAVILALPAAAINLWLLARPTSATAIWALAGRQWAIDEPVWQLTGVTLLLFLAAIAHFALNRHSGDEQQPTWLFTLAAAALPVIWAADARTRVMGLGLLALVWAASIAFDRSREPGDLGRRLIPALPFAPALFSLWLAGVLPTAALPFSLLAAVLLFCVQPPAGRAATETTALDLLRGGLPVVAGAAVLLAALRGVVPSGAEVAGATALGLLGLVIGLWRAWYQWPERLPEALRPALCGLLLTAAVWVGPAALLPAARLAVFAQGLLVIADALRPTEQTVTRARWAITPRTIGAAAVFLAVAGLPLTVGFGVLAPLYGAWLASGGWVLLAVTVILLTMWLATLFGVARLLINDGAPGNRIGWLRGAALLPLLAGLVHFNTAALGVGPVIWAAIGLPIVAGLLLGRFAPAPETVGGLLREAASLPPAAARLTQRARQMGRATYEALGDALAILEGEYGLLWLLGLLLLLLWLA